ncbi:ankyrin repeat-containing domain protein [Neocallimastix lanati (nom. inval.)]|nr:ankyrin repeat-containing domain protein [Neocallimastix sp. JGI-2020a]
MDTSPNDILLLLKNPDVDLKTITNYINNNDISLEIYDVMSVLLPYAINNKVSKDIIRYFLNICDKSNFLEFSIQNMNEKYVKHITKFFVYDNNFILKLLNKYKNSEVINLDDLNRLINKEINITLSQYKKIISMNKFNILKLLLVFENTETIKILNNEFKLLIKAVENNSLDVLKILYNHGIDLNEKQYNRTALSLAAFNGFENVAKFLVNKVENISDKNNFYRLSPLFIALRRKNFNIIPILLETNKIYIDDLDNNGNTALVYAVKYGNIELVKTMVKYGANINVKSNNGKPILIIAVKNNNIEIVRYLIKCGIDLNNVDNNGDSALSIAIRCELLEISKILIDNGANINIKDGSSNTLLLTSLLTNNEELYSYLLNKCNDLNIKNYDDKTVLNIFTEKEDLNKVKLIIYYGADINSVDIYGNTPLLIAINKKNDQLINYLIDYGADINIRDKNGDTPLIIATKRNYIKCCEKLIQSDVNVNCKDSYGNTPLMIAIKHEKIELVKMLIKDSCLNEENNLGETPLSLAIGCNSMEMIKLIIKNGANINYKYKAKGDTILMKIFDNYSHKKGIIEYLINKGGNINELNNEGRSILSEICRNRHTCLLYDKERIDFLINNGAEFMTNIFCYSKEVEGYLRKKNTYN